MNSSEIFRTDGSLHDLAIERRIAGELNSELAALFDAHIADHVACRTRYEEALTHQSSWTPPALHAIPKQASLGTPNSTTNIAANRPMSHFYVPALGLSAAAAAAALFFSSSLDPEQLTTTVSKPLTNTPLELQLEVTSGTPDQGTLTSKSPGHVAVVQLHSDGSYGVIYPAGEQDSQASGTSTIFPLDTEQSAGTMVGFHCQDPFKIAAMVSAVQRGPQANVEALPEGCARTQ
jgi:hypothetical protein